MSDLTWPSFIEGKSCVGRNDDLLPLYRGGCLFASSLKRSLETSVNNLIEILQFSASLKWLAI